MKTVRILPLMMILVSLCVSGRAQDMAAEVPGDNFSLEGALELFKKSKSPEEFEKLLNSADSKVNNLDLNGDGYIDYVRVLDRNEGSVHAFVLQAVVSDNEFQDVAVIELEKKANGKAVLQIVGDEDVYGVETIIEPTEEVRTYAGTTSTQTVVNVWAWPSVQYVYGPSYALWISPWGWHLRPVWWNTWRPIAYVNYYPYWRPYRRYYSVCDTYRIGYAQRIYRPYRTTSVVVYNRHRDDLVHYRSTYHDGDRYARRNDQGRTYVQTSSREASDSRGRDIDRNRRSSPEANATPSGNRSTSREQTVRPEIRSSNPDTRRRVTESPDATQQPRVTTPTENRRRTVDSPVQRTSTPERSVHPATESPSATPRRQVTTPSENRSRSVDRPVQRTSIPERTVRPEVQRTPAPVSRPQAPERRSASIQTERQSRPQASTPSVSRSRSMATHSAPARSNTRSSETRSSAPRRGRN